ncbi:MAG: 23S rRNA (pseudouridine(1915)-N(3))-methyltransferase RlmH [Bacteroidales bacterium]|jgi:23S rRNA (pseudouridine1915-N3)-methyltransferase|nr:23S rRNA (pseudouridine(1915)-N(3))-methyltransferase RlmH [Bacteroidales bacterium]
MKIILLLTGKTNITYINDGLMDYFKRINHYIRTEIITIPDIKGGKNYNITKIQSEEAGVQKKYFTKADFIVLLDENGEELSSVNFARFVEHKMQTGIKNLMFVIGGAYGFSDEIRNIANAEISLSRLTFPHQLVRLIFMEQLYRAFTIIRNEKYHHS